MAGSAVIGYLRAILSLDTAEFESGVKKTQEKTSAINKTLGTLGTAVAGAFTVGAIVNFTGKIFDAASQIHDMAAALGFSAEAFQRNKFAAEQSGGTVEGFSKAAQRLNDALGEGSKSTIAALKAAGLEFEDIRSMKPEDAWIKVTDAVGQIQDPLTRATVAQDLFGKNALQLLPGMIEGYGKLGAAATVMSNETVDRLEKAQDSWEKFWNSVTIMSGEAIGFVMNIEKRAHDERIKNLALMSEAEKLDQARMMASNEVYLTGADYATAYAKALEKILPAHKDIALPAKKHVEVTAELTEEQKKGKQAQEAYNAEVEKLARTLTGADIADQVKKLAAAIKLAGGEAKIGVVQLKELSRQVLELERKGATLTPALKRLADKEKGAELQALMLSTSILDLGKSVDITKPKFPDLYAEVKHLDLGLFNLNSTTTGLNPPPMDPWQKWYDTANYAIDGISHSISYGLTEMVGHWNNHAEILKGIWEGIKNTFLNILDQMLSSFINSFLKGLISGIGAARLGETLASAILGAFGMGGGGAAGVIGGALGIGGAAGGTAIGGAAGAGAGIIGGGSAAGGTGAAGAAAGVGGGIGIGAAAAFIGGAAAPFIIGHLINPGPHYQAYLSPDQAREAYAEYGLPAPEDLYHVMPQDVPWWQGYPAGSGAETPPGFARGTHGQYVDFGAGTLAMLHGPEMIVPKGETADASWSGGGMMTVIIEQEGRAAARHLLPFIEGEVRRLKLDFA